MFGDANFRAVKLASSLNGLDARPRLPAVTIKGPFLRNLSLGQAWPGTSLPSTPTTSTQLKCYRCGTQGVRSMTPGMAAMVPGGCVEVPQSECDAVAAPSGGTTAPTGSPADGPTEITVLAKEPTELKPYAGGADVLIQGYNVRNWTVVTEVARGKTDANGKYVWTGRAPAPGTEYRYKVSVSVGGGSKKTVEVLARSVYAAAAGNGMVSKSEIVVPVCPSNVDALVCAVAEAQLDWRAIYNQQLVAWNYETAGPGRAKIAAFAADQASANVQLKHPALMARWDTYRWWVGDDGIPPKDWPDLIKYVDQTLRIFNAIPFPQWPGIEDLFSRCARGVPIGQGKQAERYNIASPRLYSKTWSNYFPRTDKQISKDMAAAYIIGLQPILLCMQHKIEKKIEETRRSARTMAVISYCTILVNLPLLIGAGVGGFAAFATETYDFIVMMKQGKEPLGMGVTAAIAAASLAAGDPNLVVAALEPIVGSLLEDMDPTTAAAIKMIYPQVVKFAVESVGSVAAGSVNAGSNTVVNGASSFLDMSGIASAISVMAVKAIAALPKLYAADRIEELQDSLAGAQAAAQDVIGFVAGEEVSPTFKPFLLWVVEAMGLVELVNEAIDDFLDQFQQALESGAQQGGDVAVVPEAGGGGPAVVPTDSEGTPTDATGAPLPGGEAPLTPPSGGSTIPGVPPPSMPPMPTTTTTPGMEGVTPISAAAGVGGATLALLLVTGAIS